MAPAGKASERVGGCIHVPENPLEGRYHSLHNHQTTAVMAWTACSGGAEAVMRYRRAVALTFEEADDRMCGIMAF